MPGPDIFLSYNREDQAVAKRFAEAFEAAGLSVWWDVTLRSGEAYDRVTENALRSAGAVVVLWSPRSVDSRWVRAEASIADEKGTMVPAKIEVCELPVMFRLTQTADLSHWRGEPEDKAWQAFIGDVRRKAGSDSRSLVEPTPDSVQASAAAKSGGGIPFVALLPITHRAGDEDMEILAEDLTEDITRELAQSSFFKVIGAGTMAGWRGGAVNYRTLGHKLEASYLIEGKLQRSGENVRLTVQLIDSTTGGMLRSDRHSRSYDEIDVAPEKFSVSVASELGEHITQIEAKRAIEKQGPLSGWDHFMRAVALMERLEPESITNTIAEARKAIAAAPDLGLAHALAARMIATTWARDGREPDEVLRREIHEYIRRAMQLDGNNPVILHYVVGAYINLRDGEAALRLARRAVELNPNSPRSRFALGQALYMSGRHAEAIAEFEDQLRLAPHDLNRPHALLHLGVCLCIEDRQDEAEAVLDRSLALHPDSALALTIKSIAVALQGREDAAKAVFIRMREIDIPYTYDQQQRLVGLMMRHRAEEAVAIFCRLWEATGGERESI